MRVVSIILTVEQRGILAGASLSVVKVTTEKIERTKMQKYKLAERAVLMRMSAGMPGKTRTDKILSDDVKQEHGLGKKSGRWVKSKYPDWALEKLEGVVNQARAYHAAVTLPFDNGIGILPAALIKDYADKMRQFRGEFEALRDADFVARYPEMIEWARNEHNGTFDPSDYPPVDLLLSSFYFKTEPLPVPDAAHFEGTMSSLLGIDAEAVNVRVADAMQEAQRELMRRMIDPVKAMAATLVKEPATGKKDIIFRDTLIGNIQEIADLVPKLNISGDPAIDQFAKELDVLCRYTPKVLREDKATRSEAAKLAEATMKRMEAYKF